MNRPKPTTVVFDLGGVLIDWNPRHLYRRLFAGRADEMEFFLAEICSQAWNERQDRGRSFAEGVAELVERHPAHADLIRAYDTRWPEMLGGPIVGTVALLARLKAAGVPLYALTNWSAEKFVHARERFAFLDDFEGIVVSSEVGLIKPERAIFAHLCDRFGLDRRAAVLIDDSPANVAAATDFGLDAVRFHSPERLEGALVSLGLL